MSNPSRQRGPGGPGYALARPHRLSLDTTAAQAGMHPDLVRRFVALSLLEASYDADGTPWFVESAPLVLARIQRLRAGLSLNYAAIGLVLDLLDRIDRMETALRSRPTARGGTGGDPRWT
ncbi:MULTISPECIES: chaperone modulator CbpM [unclassified Saccharopolyspora]|uniref:chaperone modulator CbpM n=1 Tax=unclassified Saccharopolyspora TaxID=2646250 RepID=UPI001CD71A05|nr:MULTISPECIES: chaperone modulator CbpM [unclassified Saccharopolyspora]MCA1188760.1 chaperone modulator CbpM [Saccharopolyspora sp. 6T]MCA1194485.1 chaperone modulator CbpM [Saccharopolyspora sp. 6V]MCA1226679.1 chaperone modulator CbpM [Saccharopolyspora sp. 6M]MCA1278974.1 chaperone modulator CbpM [Saccharopolyspora sp. 7B]